MVYGQLSGCFSVREIENSLLANSSKLGGDPQSMMSLNKAIIDVKKCHFKRF
jgi:hypothetical protein